MCHVKGYVVYTDHEAKRASFAFSATRSEIQALFPDKPMIGVAAKAPPASKTKAKGKGKAPAKAQVQTALKSDPFAPPHGHDSALSPSTDLCSRFDVRMCRCNSRIHVYSRT